MAKVNDCDLEVSEFGLQSLNYVHFRIITFENGVNPLLTLFSRQKISLYHHYSSTLTELH